MFGLGTTELIIILVLVMIIFGAGKLPQVGGALGKGLRNFKDGVKDGNEEKSEEDPEKIDDKDQDKQSGTKQLTTKKATPDQESLFLLDFKPVTISKSRLAGEQS